MTTVELQRLSRRYGKVAAVDSLDLDVGNKEFVVVLGPSGCGKTTILNMIAGTDAPTSGHILFDGRQIVELDEVLTIKHDSAATFLRLVPLVGG